MSLHVGHADGGHDGQIDVIWRLHIKRSCQNLSVRSALKAKTAMESGDQSSETKCKGELRQRGHAGQFGFALAWVGLG